MQPSGPITAIRVHQLRFAIVASLIYVALSWSVRFDLARGEQIASLAYPLDTFSMYARVPAEGAGYLLVRDAAGKVHRITSFQAFDCDQPLAEGVQRCAESVRYHIRYHHDDFLTYIERHRGPGEMGAEIISRSWQLPVGKAPQHLRDCVIAHCRVGR
jgi:hypothetical protein